MSIGEWFRQLNFGSVFEVLITVLAALTCIIFHECAHGLVALWLGDRTAKNQGRLTLNPIKHVDWIGLIMMAVAKIGWAKPVHINPRNFKNPKLGMAITAAAGPLCNLLMAVLGSVVYGLLFGLCWYLPEGIWQSVMSYLLDYLQMVILISCGLTVFNLIPIPPLDGSKILAMVLPPRYYNLWMRYEFLGMFLLIAVFVVMPYITDFSPIGYLQGGLFDIMVQYIIEPISWIPGL